MSRKYIFIISKKKIKIDYINFVFSRDNGAVMTFIGIVRNLNYFKRVDSIFYFVFDKLMHSIMSKKCSVLLNDDNVSKICIIQGIGRLYVGDINLLIGVSSPHRHQAFFYCNNLIEFIKTNVPIWKKEYYCDGSYKWINV